MLILDNETVDLDTSTGVMRCRIFRPKDASQRWPGIILYPEIFHTTGPIARAAQTFAGHGFAVIVPECFHESFEPGTVLTYTPSDTAKGNACKSNKLLSAWDSDTAACVGWLQASPHCNGKIGTAGFCLGGGLAFRAALHPGVRAAACWYATDLHKGGLSDAHGGDDTLARIGELAGRVEVLMIYGRQDPHIPLEGRAIMHAALTTAAVDMQWLEVNGQHAFMRDEHSYGRYDAQLAFFTMQAALALFGRTLR